MYVSVSQRLIEAIDYLVRNKLVRNQTELADELNLSKGYMSLIAQGKRDPSEAVVNSFVNIYRVISKDWLLTGEGQMIAGPEETPKAVALEEASYSVPLLPLYAQGGRLNDFVASVTEYECERIVSPIAGIQFGVTVVGESMAPEYPSGSIVLAKRIDERIFIEWGRVYVLDTANGVVIKRLEPSDKGSDFVKCVSVNKDFAPFDIGLNKESVFGIYRVLMCMSMK